MFSILKKVMTCVNKRQPADEDWELYEEAALQREIESDHKDEGSEESSSIASLPTY